MSKNTKFPGIPIISQVLKFIDRGIINRTALKHKSDRYYKSFKTYDHLITMIYAVISNLTSLREVSSIMLACEGKINHLGLKKFPRRSTLSDANKKRSSKVFAEIYYELHRKYRKFLSDGKSWKLPIKDLNIVDSSVISLFSEILKGSGRKPLDGKKKGGIKMHTMISALEDVPSLVRFTSASTHDHEFLKDLGLKPGSYVVFDKGYNDYYQYLQWSMEGIFFVTRQKDNADYTSIAESAIPDTMDEGVLKDEIIVIEKDGKQIKLRRIAYWVEEQNKVYEFITNNFELDADIIALIYKYRWQIELLFKRLKQNFPLKYFLGDSVNAIEIQIWVSLIVQLIMLVIQRQVARKWAFSNMIAVIRHHFMSYIDLFKFLKNPEAGWDALNNLPKDQLKLFDTG